MILPSKKKYYQKCPYYFIGGHLSPKCPQINSLVKMAFFDVAKNYNSVDLSLLIQMINEASDLENEVKNEYTNFVNYCKYLRAIAGNIEED